MVVVAVALHSNPRGIPVALAGKTVLFFWPFSARTSEETVAVCERRQCVVFWVQDLHLFFAIKFNNS